MSDSLQPHGLQHARPPCPSPTPEVYSNSCPLSRWCHPTISSSVVPFSARLQSFPASGSFQMNQLFAWGGQSVGVSASASVLPMNTQDWSPFGWTGWISLQSKGLSESSPSPQFKTGLLFDHFQFALIHGPNMPGSYAILLFTASDFTSITRHIHNRVLFLLWLHLFILSGVISPLVERSDKTWCTGEGNDKPLQHSCLENPMNGMKRQKDRTLKDELPRSVGAQYATRDGWRSNSRKTEETEVSGKPWMTWVSIWYVEYCWKEILSPIIRCLH